MTPDCRMFCPKKTREGSGSGVATTQLTTTEHTTWGDVKQDVQELDPGATSLAGNRLLASIGLRSRLASEQLQRYYGRDDVEAQSEWFQRYFRTDSIFSDTWNVSSAMGGQNRSVEYAISTLEPSKISDSLAGYEVQIGVALDVMAILVVNAVEQAWNDTEHSFTTTDVLFLGVVQAVLDDVVNYAGKLIAASQGSSFPKDAEAPPWARTFDHIASGGSYELSIPPLLNYRTPAEVLKDADSQTC